MIEKIIVFIFGSLIGSFLNTCIHRMPLEESVVWPRSYCPKCKKKIRGIDNIPLLSYILLGARCRFCKERISFRYFIVELLTAAIFLILFLRFGLTYDFFFFLVLVCSLIVATFVDIAHRIIPDEISIGGMIVGFILSSVRGVTLGPLTFHYKPLLDSFLGIITGGAVLYLTGTLFDFVYFRLLKKPPIQGETQSMGGGDVKLLAMIGAFLGWQKALMVFFLSPFLGAVIGIINLLVKKDHTIPFGPFLSLSALLVLFWADKILHLVFIVP
ncbi:MAG: prepilin peptidase [Candidatus Omnitrophota bacterium]